VHLPPWSSAHHEGTIAPVGELLAYKAAVGYAGSGTFEVLSISSNGIAHLYRYTIKIVDVDSKKKGRADLRPQFAPRSRRLGWASKSPRDGHRENSAQIMKANFCGGRRC
jgi:hypothetical protein